MSTILNIVAPSLFDNIGKIIVKGQSIGIDMGEICKYGIILIFLYGLGALFNTVQGFIMARVAADVTKKYRSDISKKINRLPLKYYDSNSFGDTLSRITNDVDTLGQSLSNSLSSTITSVTMIVGSLIMMFVKSPILALIMLAFMPISTGLVLLVVKFSQKYFIKQQVKLGEINGQIEEIYSAHNVVSVFNGKDKAQVKFDETNKELFSSGFRANFLSGLIRPVMHFIGNLSYVAVCVMGGYLAIKNNDPLFAVTIAVFINYMRMFNNQISNIANISSTLQSTAAASERVFEFLDEKEQQKEDKQWQLKDVKGNVEFKNVSFGYSEDKTIIHNFSAKIKAGQKVAIVGPTGAGKTTIVNLLMRFYELKQPRLIVNRILTDYKVFDNGKSIKLIIDENNVLTINDKKTEFILKEKNKKLPKNKLIKFNQDFDLNVNNELVDFDVKVVTGNDVDKQQNCCLGVAYYGDIFIDGIPIKSISRQNLHDLFDMILQDTWLFDGTIRENLVYNNPDVSIERLDEVCSAVGLKHFIQTLKYGYETKLDSSLGLSEGQKQQLTIARAMLKDSPLLILDEATSSVDTRTELVIQNAMDKLTKGRTSFVIAHRLSTIKNADVILVLKDGDIVEQGNHETLLKQNGFYAELYNSQFVKTA